MEAGLGTNPRPETEAGPRTDPLPGDGEGLIPGAEAEVAPSELNSESIFASACWEASLAFLEELIASIEATLKSGDVSKGFILPGFITTGEGVWLVGSGGLFVIILLVPIQFQPERGPFFSSVSFSLFIADKGLNVGFFCSFFSEKNIFLKSGNSQGFGPLEYISAIFLCGNGIV